MAKLNFKKENSRFELEVDDEIYTGTLNDLTKRQLAAQNKILDPIKKLMKEVQDSFSKIERLQVKLTTKKRLECWNIVDKLEDDIFKLQDDIKEKENKVKIFRDTKKEDMFKKRIEDTIESDYILDILVAGDKYGYENVFNTIIKDIQERNKKKKKAFTNISSN